MSQLSATGVASVTCLHTGGCSACAQSLAALEAPRYAKQLTALGVTFARVPRHGDIILLCGALTEQARASVSGLIAGTPHPRALVAVGDCAVNRCVFADSPCLSVPLTQAFQINVEIGGCPPTPQAVIEAISEAKRLLSDQPTTLAAPGAADAAPGATPRVAPPLSAPDLSGAASAPGGPARLAALIAAAGEGWDDDDESDDLNDVENDDARTDVPPPAQTTRESEHLTGTGNGATGARQHKEKH